MILYHTTREANLASILETGLQLRFAKGARRVWACMTARRKWARKHVCKRHGWKDSELVVLEIAVPDNWLTRWSDGVFWVGRDVPPTHIMSVQHTSTAYAGD